MYTGRWKKFEARFECRQVILENWTQMTPGCETLNYGIFHPNYSTKGLTFKMLKFVNLSALPLNCQVSAPLALYAIKLKHLEFFCYVYVI